jgi:hypothetical protein
MKERGSGKEIAEEIHAMDMDNVRPLQCAKDRRSDRIALRAAERQANDLDIADVLGAQEPFASRIVEDAIEGHDPDPMPETSLAERELADEILEPADPRVKLPDDMDDRERTGSSVQR